MELIPKDNLLNEELLKVVVIACIKPYVQKYTSKAWNYFSSTCIENFQNENESVAFSKLIDIVRRIAYQNNIELTRENVEFIFSIKAEEILSSITPDIEEEYLSKESIGNKQIVQNTLVNNAYSTSQDVDIHLVKNSYAKGSEFKNKINQKVDPVIEVSSQNGKHSIRAKYDHDNISISTLNNHAEQKYFDKMLQNSYNVMDDGVVDMLDIACFLSMYAEKDQHGYVEFHYNDAAILKNSKHLIEPRHQKAEKKLPLRLKAEVMSVMERIAALSKLWFSIREGLIQDEDNLTTVKYKDWQKMFEIGKVRYLYDQDDQPLGIYALQIRPTELLIPYLQNGASLGLVELTAIEFHPYKEKYEKRLTRYLYNFFYWNKNAQRNVTVKTLLYALDFASRINGVEKYEKLMVALQNLKERGVIKDYEWVDTPPDKKTVGKKGWFNDFLSLRILIKPSEKMMRRNQEKQHILTQKGISIFNKTDNSAYIAEKYNLESPSSQTGAKNKDFTSSLLHNTIITENRDKEMDNEQLSFSLGKAGNTHNIELKITGEMILKERKRRKISLRQMANEIDHISPSTIQRFEKSVTVKSNSKTYKKITKWYTKSILKGI